MANNNSTSKRGSYICKVGEIDIYQKTSYKGEGKNKVIINRELCLYHAKKLIQGGFKTKDLAVAKASELMSQGMDAVRVSRKK